jgi:signal transduction histidine kinase
VSKKALESLNFDSISTSGNTEVSALVDSFQNFSGRISDFVMRERNFSRYASHELRTPLTILKNSAALLKKQGLSPAHQKIIRRMDNTILDMQELIESLLLLSREQNIVLSKQPIVVNDFLKDISEKALLRFDEKHIQLNWNAKNLIECHIPEQLFSIVINNILLNACLYSEDKSTINISIIDSKIIIQDHGVGMNKQQLNQIFKPFYRANEYSKVKGFGLGLSIVDWICKQCDWEISFASQENIGTTVTLDLHHVTTLV